MLGRKKSKILRRIEKMKRLLVWAGSLVLLMLCFVGASLTVRHFELDENDVKMKKCLDLVTTLETMEDTKSLLTLSVVNNRLSVARSAFGCFYTLDPDVDVGNNLKNMEEKFFQYKLLQDKIEEVEKYKKNSK